MGKEMDFSKNEEKRSFCLKLDLDLAEKIRELAYENRRPQTRIIISMIEHCFSELESKKTEVKVK